MTFIEMNWNPTLRQLRQFGIICAVAMPLIAWIWGADQVTSMVLVTVGIGTAMVGFFLPRALKPIFVTLSIVTTPIGLILGELAIAVIYCAVFMPIGLLFRLMGRDALQLKIDKSARSYWQPRKPVKDVRSYFRQS